MSVSGQADRCPYANLMDPKLIGEGMPNDRIAEIREAGPAVRIEDPVTGVPYWAVLQKEAIDYVSMNNHLFSSEIRSAIPMEMSKEQVENIQQNMFLNMDPPRNLEYRTLIRDNFLPATVASYGEKLRRVAKEVVDVVIDKGECEFVEDIAAEMPLITILELFEIPMEERRQFFDWTNTMFFGDDPEFTQVPGADGMTPAEVAAMQVIGYFAGMAQKWRGRTEKNLCTQMLNSSMQGEPMSDEVFLWTCLMLMSAGNESTRTAIAQGMRNLMEHPEQYRYLQEHPAALDDAIEEMLRYNTSFICMRRTATKDHVAPELGKVEIRKGDKIVMYYHGANHDPTLFGDDAEEFDIHRPSRIPNFKRHMRSFGYGKHNCLGMHLARLEMKIQLGEVLRRMNNPRFAGPVKYIQSNFVQGIRAMPITFDKA